MSKYVFLSTNPIFDRNLIRRKFSMILSGVRSARGMPNIESKGDHQSLFTPKRYVPRRRCNPSFQFRIMYRRPFLFKISSMKIWQGMGGSNSRLLFWRQL